MVTSLKGALLICLCYGCLTGCGKRYAIANLFDDEAQLKKVFSQGRCYENYGWCKYFGKFEATPEAYAKFGNKYGLKIAETAQYRVQKLDIGPEWMRKKWEVPDATTQIEDRILMAKDLDQSPGSPDAYIGAIWIDGVAYVYLQCEKHEVENLVNR